MTIPPPTTFYPGDAAAGSKIAALPAAAGVYSIVPLTGEAHISSSRNLPRRIQRLMRTFQSSISHIDCWPAVSRLDVLLVLYAVTRSCFPNDYAQRLRLRMPWFVRLSESDSFPQLLTTNRIPPNDDCVLGPFASRDFAQAFQEKAEGLFQLRRCLGKLVPAPDHPGCIYGEMNQCLRPCQGAVSQEEYATEVKRTLEFLVAEGRTTVSGLTVARERASSKMDFEAASQIHRRLEKVRDAIAMRDAIVSEVHRFSGVALTPASEHGSCFLRPMLNGCWQEPVLLDFSDRAESRESMDVAVREQLERILSHPVTIPDPAEHLALFSRWYRSTWRDGEWFPFKTLDTLDYRKLVRRISKLIKPEHRPPDRTSA